MVDSINAPEGRAATKTKDNSMLTALTMAVLQTRCDSDLHALFRNVQRDMEHSAAESARRAFSPLRSLPPAR
jgi:hypothetical protein